MSNDNVRQRLKKIILTHKTRLNYEIAPVSNAGCQQPAQSFQNPVHIKGGIRSAVFRRKFFELMP